MHVCGFSLFAGLASVVCIQGGGAGGGGTVAWFTMLAGSYLLLLSKEGDNEVTNWSPWLDRWQPRSVVSARLFLSISISLFLSLQDVGFAS